MPYQNLTPMKRIIIIVALALVACQQKPLSDLSLIKMGSPISDYKLDANDFSDKGMQPMRYEVPLFHMIEEMPDEDQWRPLMHTFEGETYNYTYGGVKISYHTTIQTYNDKIVQLCIMPEIDALPALVKYLYATLGVPDEEYSLILKRSIVPTSKYAFSSLEIHNLLASIFPEHNDGNIPCIEKDEISAPTYLQWDRGNEIYCLKIIDTHYYQDNTEEYELKPMFICTLRYLPE